MLATSLTLVSTAAEDKRYNRRSLDLYIYTVLCIGSTKSFMPSTESIMPSSSETIVSTVTSSPSTFLLLSYVFGRSSAASSSTCTGCSVFCLAGISAATARPTRARRCAELSIDMLTTLQLYSDSSLFGETLEPPLDQVSGGGVQLSTRDSTMYDHGTWQRGLVLLYELRTAGGGSGQGSLEAEMGGRALAGHCSSRVHSSTEDRISAAS